MTQIINSGAQMLASARHNAETAAAELVKATEHRARVQSNISALLVKRAEIAARRASGKGDDFADGAALQIIALDLGGLEELLAAAEAEVKAATANVQAATVQVSTAERELARGEDEAILATLAPHVSALADKLYAALIEMKTLNSRLGRRDSFKPSHALQQELRRLEYGVAGKVG